MAIYLGLGSNQGDRKQNISNAIDRLISAGFQLDQVSPLVESPAMLADGADPAWNKPYLNLVVRGDADWSPLRGLGIAKDIEAALGRGESPRWSPRTMDIDLLLWHNQQVDSENLTIPHPGIADRDFVITPLMHLDPGVQIPGLNQSVFELSQGRRNIPLWMAILNITPDSFSDGDRWGDHEALDTHLDKLIERDVQIIDVGAESTRPHADQLDDKTEWQRLAPVIVRINEKIADQRVRPLVSLDSRHPRIIARAVEAGIDIINDVTGLDDPEMAAVVRDSGLQVVAMHAMSVPVDPKLLLPGERSATEQITQWIEEKAEQWTRQGLDLSKIIIDPGIGFGKTSIQAYNLMSHCAALRQCGMRLLVGHSRKSFMAGFTDRPAALRDLETLGISLALCQQGVDIIRVHQPFIHQRAYRAWSHISLD